MNQAIKSILLYFKAKKGKFRQDRFSVEGNVQVPFTSEGVPLPDVDNQPPIGCINRRIYWSVFLAALLLLAGMVNMIAQGALAISFESTVPLSITATRLTLENFRITTGFSGGVPVLITRTDLFANNFTLAQRLNIPMVGLVTMHLHADRADIYGLLTRSIVGLHHVDQIGDPYESIESATLQNANLWFTKD